MAFDEEIARITARMDTAGPRLRGLFANLNRALSTFGAARPAGITVDERGLLLAFEALLIEALNDAASLLHQRGEAGGARECLELVESLRGIVQNVIEGNS